MEFLYYPGCTLSTTAKYLDRCARGAAAALGIVFEEVENWQCCGAVFSLDPEQTAHKLSAVRVLQQTRDKGKTLVTLCAACHHVLKQVNHQAKTDAEFRVTVQNYDASLAYAGEARVMHFAEILRDVITFKELEKLVTNPLRGRKFAVYYGCLLLRPADVMQFDDAENPHIFEDLLQALGTRAVTFPMRNECCGGYRALEDANACAAHVQRVVDSALSRGADTLVTACPLCQYQLVEHAAGRLDVCYFTEVLAEALGIEDDDD